MATACVEVGQVKKEFIEFFTKASWGLIVFLKPYVEVFDNI